MWRFDTTEKLVGCGVDVETVVRFNTWAHTDDHPMPFVFTRREISHAREGHFAAHLLCLSYACKEALFKALQRPYDFTEAEVLGSWADAPFAVEQDIALSRRLKEELNIERAHFKAMDAGKESGDLISAVYVFKKGDQR